MYRLRERLKITVLALSPTFLAVVVFALLVRTRATSECPELEYGDLVVRWRSVLLGKWSHFRLKSSLPRQRIKIGLPRIRDELNRLLRCFPGEGIFRGGMSTVVDVYLVLCTCCPTCKRKWPYAWHFYLRFDPAGLLHEQKTGHAEPGMKVPIGGGVITSHRRDFFATSIGKMPLRLAWLRHIHHPPRIEFEDQQLTLEKLSENRAVFKGKLVRFCGNGERKKVLGTVELEIVW